MIDVVDKATRSKMMSGIRGRDTQPELKLRRRLHAMGFRYRLHSNILPGRPDIVLPARRAVVFVHGCFWHRHPGCRYASSPASNSEFWEAKFEKNVERDQLTRRLLLEGGWRVAIVWECSIRSSVVNVTDRLAEWLRSSRLYLEI